MNNYETLFILDPEIPEEEIDTQIGRITSYVEKAGGSVVDTDRWGMRRMAYEIRKKRQGFYVLMTFHANSPSIQDIDADFKLDQRVLRHIIVRREDGGQPVKEREE